MSSAEGQRISRVLFPTGAGDRVHSHSFTLQTRPCCFDRKPSFLLASAKLHFVLTVKENIVWVEQNAALLLPVKHSETRRMERTDLTALSVEFSLMSLMIFSNHCQP